MLFSVWWRPFHRSIAFALDVALAVKKLSSKIVWYCALIWSVCKFKTQATLPVWLQNQPRYISTLDLGTHFGIDEFERRTTALLPLLVVVRIVPFKNKQCFGAKCTCQRISGLLRYFLWYDQINWDA
eukprot:14108594-Ditylum_brightwellii.AAC.1